jgi:hypothetical protein
LSPGPVERLKPYFKPRRRVPAGTAQAAQPAPAAQPGVAQAPAAPPAGAPATAPAQAAAAADGLHARRQELSRRYAELQSDLGGLVYEMAIRDAFKTELLVRRAAELQAVDSELSAVEGQLGLAPPPGSPAPASTACASCGAALQPGAQYCARCGAAVAAPGSTA